MIIFVLLIGFLCLYKIKLPLSNVEGCNNGLFYDYMQLKKTTSIKGVFILVVFIQHTMSYLDMNTNIFDKLCYVLINDIISQSMVSMFLLYSGYGIMLSIDKKGSDYLKSIPKNRVLKVLIHYDIAVLLFYIVQLILKNEISLIKLLQALVAWNSVGNSNWYIFDILVLYLLTYISFSVFKDKKKIGLIINMVLCAVLLMVLYNLKEAWWYDTIMCYPIGMILYYLKPYIDNILNKNKLTYWMFLAVSIIILLVSFLLRTQLMFLLIKNVIFAVVVVLITMKCCINNKVLYFFGNHLISIYILQRIPMLIFVDLGIKNNYLFTILSFAATIIISIAFDYIIEKYDSVLFNKKKIKQAI